MVVLLTWVRGILSRIITLVVGGVVRRVGIGCGLLLSLDLGVISGSFFVLLCSLIDNGKRDYNGQTAHI